MFLEQLLPYLTMLLGGTSAVQFVLIWQNRKANEKSADALAVTDEANSLKVTAEVFTLLTEITKNQVSGLKEQIGNQTEEIYMLKKMVDEYKQKCGSCLKSN